MHDANSALKKKPMSNMKIVDSKSMMNVLTLPLLISNLIYLALDTMRADNASMEVFTAQSGIEWMYSANEASEYAASAIDDMMHPPATQGEQT